MLLWLDSPRSRPPTGRPAFELRNSGQIPLGIKDGGLLLTDDDFRVEKMRFGKNGPIKDLTTMIYNDRITVSLETMKRVKTLPPLDI